MKEIEVENTYGHASVYIFHVWVSWVLAYRAICTVKQSIGSEESDL